MASPLVRIIRVKLLTLEESIVAFNDIIACCHSKVSFNIEDALEAKCQALLVKYQSASTESVTARLVEPLGFTNNYQYLSAFEVKYKLNKYFKLDPIGSIEILS